MATPGEETHDVESLERIYKALSKAARGGTSLPAAQFPAALSALGLKFGDPDVDIIMPMCKVDPDTGNVDFTGLDFEITRRHQAARTQYKGLRGESAISSNKGLAFRRAMEREIGTDGMPDLPSELEALPQPDRVRKLAGPLHTLFTKFDNGDISVDVFREQLHAMGLRENLEVDRLLRQARVQFSQLYKALAMQGGNDMRPDDAVAGIVAQRTPSGGVFGTRHNAIVHNFKRRDGKKTGFEDRRAASTFDPIAWSGHDGSVPYEDHHERYLLKSDLQNRDTGAAMSLYGRKVGSTAENAPDVDLSDERFFKGGKAGHQLPAEEGAGHALWGYGHERSFVTQAQDTARSGLGIEGRPATSAGYNLRDNGLHREQIYSAIRQLDRGAINTATFRLRLKSFGCKIPLPVDKLLIEYDANGRATFKDFVRSFENYFEKRARAAEAIAAAEARDRRGEEEERKAAQQARKRSVRREVPADSGYMDRSHLTNRVDDDTPAALRSHGDILTWTNNPPITLDEHRAMVRDGIRPGQKCRNLGSRKLAAGVPRTDDAHRPIDRKPKTHRSSMSRRGAGNIIAWAGGDFKDHKGNAAAPQHRHGAGTQLEGYGGGHTAGGDLLADGTPAGLGRARPKTELARKDHTFSTPFGTARDLNPASAPTAVNASRKAFIKNPTLRGGDWMNHDFETERRREPVEVRREPAPWNKDIDAYEL